MTEITLRFNSKNRDKIGISKSHDFTTRFNTPLILANDLKYEMAVKSLSMTYSWYNIRESFGNDVIKYSKDKGANWETITFVDGMYSYDDIDEYIHGHLKKEKDILNPDETDETKFKYGINISFILSSYRVLIELDENYQLDFRDSDFGKLIGFDSKIIPKTEYAPNLPDITRGVDEIHINCDKVIDSILDGNSTSTIDIVPVVGLRRSLPFTHIHHFLSWNPISTHQISEMRFYVTDPSGDPIDLNGVDWYIELFLRGTEF